MRMSYNAQMSTFIADHKYTFMLFDYFMGLGFEESNWNIGVNRTVLSCDRVIDLLRYNSDHVVTLIKRPAHLYVVDKLRLVC